ncbi:MAG: type III secretion system chaperone, partial [Pseudomonadota bacterium]
QNALEMVISEIKTETGLDLTLDENGMTVINHTSDISVIVSADYPSGLVRLTTILGSTEEAKRDELFGDLLVVNFFPQLYGPFFFALNPDQSRLLLVGRVPIDTLEPHAMVDSFNAIVTAHTKVSELIGPSLRGQERLSTVIANRFDDGFGGSGNPPPAVFV